MKNIPNKIYLQVGDDIDLPDDFKSLEPKFVTWCEDKINKNDLEFSLSTQPQPSVSAEDKGVILARHFNELNELAKPFYQCINQVGAAMEEYRNQPVKQPTDVEIKDAYKEYQLGTQGIEVWEEGAFREGVKFGLTYNQPVKPFTPERTAQEEADRVISGHLKGQAHFFAKKSAIIDQQNTINALKLRGIDTTYEEEVLTILKGM